MPLASGPSQHFRQTPRTVKHTHDQRRAAVRCVHDDVGIASNRNKADRWRRQMRPRGADQGMLADGGRQPVEGHAEAPGRNRVLGGYPLDDCKDVSFGGGGQDGSGHRSAVSIAVSARARTSSIVRAPLSSVSLRLRAIMASNATASVNVPPTSTPMRKLAGLPVMNSVRLSLRREVEESSGPGRYRNRAAPRIGERDPTRGRHLSTAPAGSPVFAFDHRSRYPRGGVSDEGSDARWRNPRGIPASNPSSSFISGRTKETGRGR